jgi:hypothetical protein
MHSQRELSDAELTVLFAVHAGMPPAQYQAITEIDFVMAEDAEEIHVIEWTQSQRLHFLLLAARTYGRPN